MYRNLVNFHVEKWKVLSCEQNYSVWIGLRGREERRERLEIISFVTYILSSTLLPVIFYSCLK